MRENKYELHVFIEKYGVFENIISCGAIPLMSYNKDYDSDYGIIAIEYEGANKVIKYALVEESLAKEYFCKADYNQEKYLDWITHNIELLDYDKLISLIDPDNEHIIERESAFHNRFNKELSNVQSNAYKNNIAITISSIKKNCNG